jgi:photosystem II stability/assembly factor-like uncharacterized protein
MSKQRRREMARIKRQQHSRQLITGGIVLVAVAALAVLFFTGRTSEGASARAISRLTTSDFHSLAFSPIEPETIFFGHHGGLLVSFNGGRDWKPTTFTDADAMALAIPSSDPQIMYAAGHDVFFKSTDTGKTWESVETDLPGTDIHGFSVDPENANHVYAHVVGFGIFDSEDGGSHWTSLSDKVPSSTFNLAAGENSQTLYAAAGEAGLLQSTDGGNTWNKVSGAPDTGVIAVTFVPANNRLYVTTPGSAAGLYYSDDGGQTWNRSGLTGTLLAVTVSPLDPNHLVAVNERGEVFASRDGGLTWPME